MKKLLITTGLTTLLCLSSATVLAGDKHHQKNYNYNDRSERSYRQTARVTHVEPLYTTVRVSTPQRECYQRPQHRQRESYTSTIAGGLIGGVLGNQFGKGSGNTAMTIAGTLLGGSVGRDVGGSSYENSSYNDRYRGEECHVTERYHEEQRIDGYLVSYHYQGQTYTTHMDHYPGKRIPVNVSVQPAHHYY